MSMTTCLHKLLSHEPQARLDYDAAAGFSAVWQGTWLKEEKGQTHKLALKPFLGSRLATSLSFKERFLREAEIWQELQHPNILPFLGIHFDLERLSTPCLISPWMRNGNVNDYLRKHPETDRSRLLSEIAAGLDYLHNSKPPIVHSDLRGINVLISDDGQARLSNFGMTRIQAYAGFMTKVYTGSFRWMASELFRIENYLPLDDEYDVPVTQASDIWAFGMTALEIVTGSKPFAEFKHDGNVILNLARGARPRRPFGIDVRLWTVMERCWEENPTLRPSIRAVGLALDLVQRSEESDFDCDAVRSVLTARRSADGRTTNPDPGQCDKCSQCCTGHCQCDCYPCKWPGCLMSFSSLEECKDHEYSGHRSADRRTSLMQTGKDYAKL